MRRMFRILIMIGILLTATALADGLSPDHFGDVVQIVNCKSFITLREQPDTASTAIAKIPLGDQALMLFPVVGYDENNFSCIMWQGKPGYVLSDYLELVNPDDISAPFPLRWPTNSNFDWVDEERARFAEAIETCISGTNLNNGEADCRIGSEMTVTAQEAWVPVYGYSAAEIPFMIVSTGNIVTHAGHEENGRVKVILFDDTSWRYRIGYRIGWIDEDSLVLSNPQRRGTTIDSVTESDLRNIYGFMTLFQSILPYAYADDYESSSFYPYFDSRNHYHYLTDESFVKYLMQYFYDPVLKPFELIETGDAMLIFGMWPEIVYGINLQFFDHTEDDERSIFNCTDFGSSIFSLCYVDPSLGCGAISIDTIEEIDVNTYEVRYTATDDKESGLMIFVTDGGFSNPRSFRLKYFIYSGVY